MIEYRRDKNNTILLASSISASLFFHSTKGYATSSFITRFISQDVSINPEIWYLPGCNQRRAACTAKAQASRFHDVYTFYLPLNALGFCAARNAPRANSQPGRHRGRTNRTSTSGNDKRWFSEYKDFAKRFRSSHTLIMPFTVWE